MSRPVLLVGLDGATFDVLDPLLAAGELPVLARLIAGGARAPLRSVVPPITPAAWSSFLTGKQPGKHGVYDFHVYDPRAGTDVFVSSRVLRDATLWQLLTAAGRAVTVVGLPMMYPPPPDSGTVVSGFDTPSVEAAFTTPPELRERILAAMPDYTFVAVPDAADPSLESDAAFTTFLDEVERSCAQRTRLAGELLATRPWDVAMVHFQDPDALQHAAWRFIADPALSPARAARIRGAYGHLDRCLGELVAAAPPDALVLVVSDHGFGDHVGRLFPNVLLRKWGYLSWRGRWWAGVRHKLRRRATRLGLAAVPREEPWRVRVRQQGFAAALPLRWRRTRAYVALAEIYGMLFVNVRGREPAGIVPPEARDGLAIELQARLQAVRDPADGTPVFDDVVLGRDVFPDDPLGRRPDLVLVPRPGLSVHRELRPNVWLDKHRTVAGTHRSDGVLIAAGPGVRAATAVRGASLVDLAPTVLAVAGVGVPDDMDGRVLAELFATPPEVTYVRPDLPPAAGDASSAEDEQQVVERLRALGYMA